MLVDSVPTREIARNIKDRAKAHFGSVIITFKKNQLHCKPEFERVARIFICAYISGFEFGTWRGENSLRD